MDIIIADADAIPFIIKDIDNGFYFGNDLDDLNKPSLCWRIDKADEIAKLSIISKKQKDFRAELQKLKDSP